jgi:hypothetical protein
VRQFVVYNSDLGLMTNKENRNGQKLLRLHNDETPNKALHMFIFFFSFNALSNELSLALSHKSLIVLSTYEALYGKY